MSLVSQPPCSLLRSSTREQGACWSGDLPGREQGPARGCSILGACSRPTCCQLDRVRWEVWGLQVHEARGRSGADGGWAHGSTQGEAEAGAALSRGGASPLGSS